jgi:hypothetical protein
MGLGVPVLSPEDADPNLIGVADDVESIRKQQ